MNEHLQYLRSFCRHLEAGPVPLERQGDLIGILGAAWGELAGGNEEGMHGSKLGRLESLGWRPPNLTFWIERHGGTVLGSTRAAAHQWEVDVERGEARIIERRPRQVRRMAPRFKHQNLARRIEGAVLAKATIRELKWSADFHSFELQRDFLPELWDGYAQTITGRRNRLKAELAERLGDQWHCSRWPRWRYHGP